MKQTTEHYINNRGEHFIFTFSLFGIYMEKNGEVKEILYEDYKEIVEDCKKVMMEICYF